MPGAAACWADCSATFGRLPLAEALQPAVELAEGGAPVHQISAALWRAQEEQLLGRWGGIEGNPGAAALLIDGRPPKAGELYKNPALAQTLRKLGVCGARGALGFLRAFAASARGRLC